jgi:hypothetical protein
MESKDFGGSGGGGGIGLSRSTTAFPPPTALGAGIAGESQTPSVNSHAGAAGAPGLGGE